MMDELNGQETVRCWLGEDKEITWAGYRADGVLVFGTYDRDNNWRRHFSVSKATFDSLCEYLGVRPPTFTGDPIVAHIDERFDKIERMLGSS